jgi:hypothetical protein
LPACKPCKFHHLRYACEIKLSTQQKQSKLKVTHRRKEEKKERMRTEKVKRKKERKLKPSMLTPIKKEFFDIENTRDIEGKMMYLQGCAP